MRSTDAERLLRNEIATVVGCTEPAAIAHAVQCARCHLSGHPIPEQIRVTASLSPEVLRNASTAVVPVIGKRGVRAAVVAGFYSSSPGFNPFAGLKVPRTTPLLSRRTWLSIVQSAKRGIYIRVTLEVPGEAVTAIVAGRHDFIHSVMRNGTVVYRGRQRTLPRLKGLEEIKTIVERRSMRLEMAALHFIASQVKVDPGKPLMDGVEELVTKRMTGRPLPVLAITGSGNQGMFLGVPLRALHRRLGRRALPAILFSLLTQILLSQRRKRISDACGLAIKAAPALAAGLAYARGDDLRAIARAMAAVHERLGGMQCRGAEPACGPKALCALRCVFDAAGDPAGPARPPGGDPPARVSREAVARNHARLVERDAFFRRHGYDFARSIRFVLSAATPLSGDVLEVGTGKGRFLSALAAEAPSVTTVDLDPGEQRFARLNTAWAGVGRKVRFLVRDAGCLGFPDGSFDAVVSMNALHHFRSPVAAVREMARVLRPGGKIVLSDLDRAGYRIFERVFASEGRRHTRVRYRLGDLARYLRTQGLRVQRRGGCHQEMLIAKHRGHGEKAGDATPGQGLRGDNTRMKPCPSRG